MAVAAAACVATALMLLDARAAASADPRMEPEAERILFDRANDEREAAGHASLDRHPRATAVARDWAAQMAEDAAAAGEYTAGLGHNPDLAGDVGDVEWSRLGENVGYTVRTGASVRTLAGRLHDAFMGSDGHRRNIMGDWDQVGVGAVRGPNDSLWVTVVFVQGGDGGADTIDQAVQRSRTVRGEGSADVVAVSRADDYADALSATGLLGGDGPLLFTDAPSAQWPDAPLDSATAAELQRVASDGAEVLLLGGERAVSSRVERELSAMGYEVTRLYGEDRFETAAVLAEETVRRHGDPDRVVLAGGRAWPDAVSVGAFTGAARAPVLLAGLGEVPDATRSVLSEVDASVVVVGGSSVVGDEVVDEYDAVRVAGADRHGTSLAVAGELLGDPERVHVVPGWPDDTAWSVALSRTPEAVADDAAVVLSDEPAPAEVEAYLSSNGRGRDDVTVHSLP